MHWLTMFCLVIILLMIFGIGRWVWAIHNRLHTKEDEAALEHAEIRKAVESAASDAASCAAVIDKIGIPPPRRKLHAVRDEVTKVSTWHWE